MPRINTTGQEGQRKASWQEIQDLVMMSLFNATPSEEEQLRQEINDLIEEAKKNVCETDKRESN